jgi:hypothetical protein
MRALTIRQPWAWAILSAGKRIENRTWKPPEWAVGSVIALHAGGVLEEEGAALLRRRGFAVPDELPRAAIVGTARIAGVITAPVDDPWWEGPVGWVLSEVMQLPEPIPCPGKQGLWKLPDETAKLIGIE